MRQKRSTKIKMLGAIFMTVTSLFYFLATVPFFHESKILGLSRQSFLFVNWKTDWDMFAPTPRRSLPLQTLVRYYQDLQLPPEEEVIFDFVNNQSESYFKGMDKTFWPLLHLRLGAGQDCRSNCERFIDELVHKRQTQTGKKAVKAEMIWREVRIPSLKHVIIKIEDVPQLPKKDIVKFEKFYDL